MSVIVHTTPPLDGLPASDGGSIRLIGTIRLAGVQEQIRTAGWDHNGESSPPSFSSFLSPAQVFSATARVVFEPSLVCVPPVVYVSSLVYVPPVVHCMPVSTSDGPLRACPLPKEPCPEGCAGEVWTSEEGSASVEAVANVVAS